MIPKDPMILLSYVNTQLRDYYESLEALCTCRGLNRQKLLEKMDSIDYHYDEKQTSSSENCESYFVTEQFVGISLVLQRKINEKINGNFRTVPGGLHLGQCLCVLKDTLENVSPIWLLAFRFLLAGIIMTLVCIPRMKK